MAWKVVLDWDEGNTSQQGDGFKVYRSVNGGSYSLVATLPLSQTSWEDTNVSPGHRYAYRVVEYCSDLNAESPAAEITVDLPAPPLPPSAQYISDEHISLEWDEPAYAHGYDVERQENDGDWADFGDFPAGTTQADDTSTQSNSKYVYRIRAKGTPNYVSDWAYASLVYTTPAAPTFAAFTWIVVGQSLRMEVQDNAAYEQNVQFELETDGEWGNRQTLQAGATVCEWAVSGFHKYRVRARAGRTYPDVLYSAWAEAPYYNAYLGVGDGGAAEDALAMLDSAIAAWDVGWCVQERAVGGEIHHATPDSGAGAEASVRVVSLRAVDGGEVQEDIASEAHLASQDSGMGNDKESYTFVSNTGSARGLATASADDIALQEE